MSFSRFRLKREAKSYEISNSHSKFHFKRRAVTEEVAEASCDAWTDRRKKSIRGEAEASMGVV